MKLTNGRRRAIRPGRLPGLMAGGLRYIAFGLFLIADENSFGRYQLHLRMRRIPLDLDYELKRWGCTHAHVAARLLILLGFGAGYAYAFQTGLSSQDSQSLSGRAAEVLVMRLWLDALIATGSPPASTVGDEYLIHGPAYEDLIDERERVLAQRDKE